MMKNISIRLLFPVWIFFALVGLCLISSAWAQPGQDIFLANAKAMSLGHAVTADPPGIDSIHFNPAGLAKLHGRQFEFKGISAAVSLTGDFSPSPTYTNLIQSFGFQDAVSNSHSKIKGLSIFLPKVGFIDLPPVVAAGLGGVAWESKRYGITFADAVYSPIIGGVNRDDNDPGRYSYHRAGITRLTYFSPSFGMYLTDDIAIGASLGSSYMGIGAETDLRFPNALLAGFENARQGICDAFGIKKSLCAGSLDPTQTLASINLAAQDPLSLTFNLGVLWEPTDWFSWGAVYQSGADDTLRGQLKIHYAEGTKALLDSVVNSITVQVNGVSVPVPIRTSDQTVGASIHLPYPKHFSTGVSVKVIPKWKFNADLKWTDTGVWDTWIIKLDQPVDVLSLVGPILAIAGSPGVSGDQIVFPRGYQSTWNMSFGVEHQYNDQLVFRAGYEPRPSHVPDNKRDFILPFGNADVYGLGLGYRYSAETNIDLAMALVRSHQTIPAGTSDSANSLSIGNFIYNPYAGQNIQTDLNVGLFLLSYRTQF